MGSAGVFPIAILAAATLLIRVGLAAYVAGVLASKNAAAAILRAVLDIAVATLAFWAIGAAILQSPASVVGIDTGFLFDAAGRADAGTFFYLVLVLLSTASISGAVAERSKFFPPCILSAVMAGLIIPICGHWAWHDAAWLRRLGFFDAAGASVIHLAGGIAALTAAFVVGPRNGKYNRDGSCNLIPGHNLPMASLGVLFILVGWIPYVVGATSMHGGLSPHVEMNLILSAAAATLVSMLISRARYGKPDLLLSYGGLIGGLVSVSAAGGAVSTVAAFSIGAISGLVVTIATVMVEMRFRIDDPTGLAAAQIFGGAWGTLAVGIFVPAPSFGEKLHVLGIQLLGLGVIAVFTLLLAAVVLLVVNMTVGLRISENDEFDGVDLVEHDINAYPDFQQNMIKSYHLREA